LLLKTATIVLNIISSINVIIDVFSATYDPNLYAMLFVSLPSVQGAYKMTSVFSKSCGCNVANVLKIHLCKDYDMQRTSQ